MQLSYKQSIEIAEEEAISMLFQKYILTNKRLKTRFTYRYWSCKTTFNKAEGIILDYVDPANLVYSYTNDPNFQDIYYVGEIKS